MLSSAGDSQEFLGNQIIGLKEVLSLIVMPSPLYFYCVLFFFLFMGRIPYKLINRSAKGGKGRNREISLLFQVR